MGGGTVITGGGVCMLSDELALPPLITSASFLSRSALSSASSGYPSSSKACLANLMTRCFSAYVYGQAAILTPEYFAGCRPYPSGTSLPT